VEFNRRLKTASEESAAFIFLDPHDVLCAKGICTNMDKQGRLIYSDGAHLSKFGSRFVIEGFRSELIGQLELLGKL
jgi:hypothetical protein